MANTLLILCQPGGKKEHSPQYCVAGNHELVCVKVSLILLLDSLCFLLNQQDKKSEHKTEAVKTPVATLILSASIWLSGF